MKSSWRQKPKQIMLIPFILLFSMFDLCPDETEDIVETPTEAKSTFWPEYDYMLNCDIYPGDACDEFDLCNTNLVIDIDDEDLPATPILYINLAGFVLYYCDITNDKMDNKAYIFAINDAFGKPTGPQGNEILGGTMNPGEEGYAWSVLFVDAIDRNYPNYFDIMIEKVTIHELGHSRANLPHLCDSITNQPIPFHADGDCVMGSGKISTCTNEDLTSNIHFCGSCCNWIKSVKW